MELSDAKGLISTVESMHLRIPITSRLQGNNMEEAHKLINDSGLKIFSIDDLQSAAEKAMQFSKVLKMGEQCYAIILGVITDVIQQVILMALNFFWAFKGLARRWNLLMYGFPIKS